MQLSRWISALVFVAAVWAAEPPAELVIETTFTPEDCTVKAQTGDSIKVHYVRSQHSSLHHAQYTLVDWKTVLKWEQVRFEVSVR